jgi:hypothetical protein
MAVQSARVQRHRAGHETGGEDTPGRAGRRDQGQVGRPLGIWPQPEGNHRLPWAAHQHSEEYLEGITLKYKT